MAELTLDERLKGLETVVGKLADATMKGFEVREKAGDLTSNYGNFTNLHGPKGTLAYPGISPDVLNAMVLPQLGLLPMLPVRASNELSPLHAIMTGVTPGPVSPTDPTAICQPCSTPGKIKSGMISSIFGRICMSTPTINLESNSIGAVINRGEFRDLKLIGGPDTSATNKLAPTMAGNLGNVLNSEAQQIMFEFKVGWIQKYGHLLYDGNPVNSTFDPVTNELVYGEPRGLKLLINKGYRDAITGNLMPAADSKIRVYNANIAADPAGLVAEFTWTARYLKSVARGTGLMPVKWVITMPEQMFYMITDVWPCAYNTYRCTVLNNTDQRVIDIGELNRQTQEMRTGQYLWIDGEKYPVVIDDAVTETLSGSEYTAEAMFVPLTVLGNRPVTYVEHWNYDNNYAVELRNFYRATDKVSTSDNGRFFWVRRESGACISMDAVERPRYLLDAPFLAARILGIKYTPRISTRDGWSNNLYGRFYDGGNVYGNWDPAATWYSPNVYTS